jgi:hypothetical protein
MTGSAVVRCLVLLGLCCGAAPAAAQEPEETSDLDSAGKISRPIEVVFGIDDLTSWVGRGQDARLSLSIPRS